MAAPKKNGLLYFPFNVDFFYDRKIKRLRAKFGNDGVMVYIYLLCEIYHNGYYIEYDDCLILDISDDLNLSENLTRQIMDYLLGRSMLLDGTLARSVKVLTAKSIQTRYQEAKKGLKRDVDVDSELWVLNQNETLSFVKVRSKKAISENNSNKSENNSNKSENNSNKSGNNPSKAKESKVKENKGEGEAADSPPTPPPQKSQKHRHGEYSHILLTDDEYSKLVSDYGDKLTKEYIKRLDEYIQMHGKSYKDHNLTIRNWLNKDGARKKQNINGAHELSASQPSYDLKAMFEDLGG